MPTVHHRRALILSVFEYLDLTGYVGHHNNSRLATGYITTKDMLVGRQQEIGPEVRGGAGATKIRRQQAA
jgi:hypothetical protein